MSCRNTLHVAYIRKRKADESVYSPMRGHEPNRRKLSGFCSLLQGDSLFLKCNGRDDCNIVVTSKIRLCIICRQSFFLDYEFKKDLVTYKFYKYFFVHGIVLNKTKI